MKLHQPSKLTCAACGSTFYTNGAGRPKRCRPCRVSGYFSATQIESLRAKAAEYGRTAYLDIRARRTIESDFKSACLAIGLHEVDGATAAIRAWSSQVLARAERERLSRLEEEQEGEVA